MFHSKPLELTRATHAPRGERAALASQNERPMSVASGACFAGAHGRHRTESSQRLSFELSSATRAANGPRRMMRASYARSGSENSLSDAGKAEASSRAVRAVAGLRRVRSTDN